MLGGIMNDKDKVIDKIKKLFALANSSNEHEAKAASSMAQQLLTKYNLTTEEVSSTSEKYTEEFVVTGRKKTSVEWKFVQSILRSYFFIEIVQTRHMSGQICYIMFGQPHNIEIAKYVRDFLTVAFKNSFKQYRKDYQAPVGHRSSYYTGLFEGLCEQLKQARQTAEQEVGLVVVPDADLSDFVKDTFSKGLTVKSNKNKVRNTEAAAVGYDEGKKLQIAQGLDTNRDDSKNIGQTLRLGDGR